mgnify:CR=1 FL=1
MKTHIFEDKSVLEMEEVDFNAHGYSPCNCIKIVFGRLCSTPNESSETEAYYFLDSEQYFPNTEEGREIANFIFKKRIESGKPEVPIGTGHNLLSLLTEVKQKKRFSF